MHGIKLVADFGAQGWENWGKRIQVGGLMRDRDLAGKKPPPLTDDELRVIFEDVSRGASQADVRSKLKDRHRKTVNRAYNAVAEFQRRNLTDLNNAKAKEVEEAAKYGTTLSHVQSLHLRWRSWKAGKSQTVSQASKGDQQKVRLEAVKNLIADDN